MFRSFQEVFPPISKGINLSLGCDVVNNRFVSYFRKVNCQIIIYLVIEQFVIRVVVFVNLKQTIFDFTKKKNNF